MNYTYEDFMPDCPENKDELVSLDNLKALLNRVKEIMRQVREGE